MPIQVEEMERAAPQVPLRKRWTRSECAVLEEMRLLDQQHLELVDGELISKMGKNRPHVLALALLMDWVQDTFGRRFVHQEAPIDVALEDNPTNEPEPDVIVLKRDRTDFRGASPGPEDLRLVVEVADTSLGFDLTTKARLYARAGIFEYWVLDVAGRRLIVHRNPEAGRYASITAYSETEAVSPLAAPQAELRVADVL
jgi:Uma2 family endonuclease